MRCRANRGRLAADFHHRLPPNRPWRLRPPRLSLAAEGLLQAPRLHRERQLQEAEAVGIVSSFVNQSLEEVEWTKINTYLNHRLLLVIIWRREMRCSRVHAGGHRGGGVQVGCRLRRLWLHEGYRSLRVRRAHCRRLHVLHVVGHVLRVHVLHPHRLLLPGRRGRVGHRGRHVLLYGRPRGHVVSRWVTWGGRWLIRVHRRRSRRRYSPSQAALCRLGLGRQRRRPRGFWKRRLPAHQVDGVTGDFVVEPQHVAEYALVF